MRAEEFVKIKELSEVPRCLKLMHRKMISFNKQNSIVKFIKILRQ